MSFSLIQTVAPIEEPVTVTEAKTYARVEGTGDATVDSAQDTLIGTLIASARSEAEAYTKRQFITATWRYSLDAFPAWEICVPRPRLITVSSIVYVATDGTATTMDAEDYSVDTDAEPGRITPTYNTSWPTTRDVRQAVKVTYTAGYGLAASVPEGAKLPIKWLVAWWLEHREAMDQIPQAFYRLLNQFHTGEA